ncbi:ATP-binding protein [Natronohydrobacter thiooxidans]|uniref:ATP-binding protein n=1 Tax=Natronohydrobacter thiooxidans TaxID=87172 RepID=UPI000AF2759B|nr:ATP-binding protein [Natronohydrobacter thiooxidans]
MTDKSDILPRSNDQRLTEVQALVVDLIHRLLSTEIANIDAVIDDCLSLLGSFNMRDRAYVFVSHGGFSSNTHEWCAPGVEPMIDHLQNLPDEDFAGFLDPLRRNEAMQIADIDELPTTSLEYQLLSAQKIRSLLVVPMLDGGNYFGMVGFDSVARRGDFLPGEVYLLRAFADVIRAVLTRRMAMQDMHAAQSELARERAFLQGIVSTNASGFLVFDEHGLIIYANDACEDVLGVSLQDLIGQPFDSPNWQVTDLDGNRFTSEQEPFAIVQRSGRIVQNHRIALHCPDGLRYASINAAPIPGGEATTLRVVYAVSDVTALVEADKAREAALASARRANETKSNFLANMSHEMRTPLNGILGISSILADSVADPEHRRMIAILQDSGHLLMSIINDLLDMTKIEADALELETIPFCLATLARRIEEVHTLRASEKQLSFSVHLHDTVRMERLGDPHRLMQIIHNLVSNAVKFTEQGFVSVTLRATDPEGIVLEVHDSGIGMAKDQQARIFEPFAQADTSISRRFGGTGLGMSIVKRLVDMMGGEMEIHSAPDAGCRIALHLPLPVAEQEALPARPTPPALPLRDLTTMRVLAADDNRTNQMILGMMLGQLGAQVTMADDGLEALDLYRQDQFDLLLLDISMPRLDGVTLLRTLREIERSEGRPHVPALAFTANAMTHQVEAYLAAGFDGCLTKPLTLAKLREALQALEEAGRASG